MIRPPPMRPPMSTHEPDESFDAYGLCVCEPSLGGSRYIGIMLIQSGSPLFLASGGGGARLGTRSNGGIARRTIA